MQNSHQVHSALKWCFHLIGTKQENGEAAGPLWIQSFWWLLPQHTGSSANRWGEAVLQSAGGLYFSSDNKTFLELSSAIWHSSSEFKKSKINKKVQSVPSILLQKLLPFEATIREIIQIGSANTLFQESLLHTQGLQISRTRFSQSLWTERPIASY